MQAVKLLSADFLRQRQGDRVGLILFGDFAVTRAPITYDLQTVAQFIEQTETGDAGERTAIGDALGLGIQQLAKSNLKDKIIVLITDGEDTVSQLAPLEAAKLAKDAQIKIYTIGIGKNSSWFSSSVDEASLKQIARTTEAQFFRARSSQDLFAIYQQLNQFEPTDDREILVQPNTELFFMPLTLALSLLLLHIVWRTTVPLIRQ